VLVHCFMGQSRSCAMVVAFLVSEGRDLLTARSMIPHAQINCGFALQLQLFEIHKCSRQAVSDALAMEGPSIVDELSAELRRIEECCFDADVRALLENQLRDDLGQFAKKLTAEIRKPWVQAVLAKQVTGKKANKGKNKTGESWCKEFEEKKLKTDGRSILSWEYEESKTQNNTRKAQPTDRKWTNEMEETEKLTLWERYTHLQALLPNI